MQGEQAMSISDLIRRPETSRGPLSSQELVARYQRMRAVSRKLNDAMVQRLPKDALNEGGRKLGMLRNGIFVFDDELDTAVLMDYCLYHVRRNGRNMVEQYCRDNPPVPGTDEWACLHAMQHAIHSLFYVDQIEPGVALVLVDLATDERFLLVDIGLSQSATPGILILTRLLLYEDFATTGGAGLAAGSVPPAELAAFSANWKKVSTSRDADYDPSSLICEFLQRGVGERTRYRDPPSAPVRDPKMLQALRKQRAARLKRAEHASPTRRCPCGSGKMFKNCCLRKPQ